jgi:hypothetical protein
MGEEREKKNVERGIWFVCVNEGKEGASQEVTVLLRKAQDSNSSIRKRRSTNTLSQSL